MLSHRKLLLPNEYVCCHHLSSEMVDMLHIKDLVDMHSGSHLKLTPSLTIADITNKSHFIKMNVGKASNLLSNSVSAGLCYIVEKKKGRPSSYLTAYLTLALLPHGST